MLQALSPLGLWLRHPTLALPKSPAEGEGPRTDYIGFVSCHRAVILVPIAHLVLLLRGKGPALLTPSRGSAATLGHSRLCFLVLSASFRLEGHLCCVRGPSTDMGKNALKFSPVLGRELLSCLGTPFLSCPICGTLVFHGTRFQAVWDQWGSLGTGTVLSGHTAY